ncbi:lysophospholipase, putative [Plasmodium knowlesi strain H]|uniref:Lysophospholipase, putative n=3 Tax=Plasmodium knowlesi TaxID=5850 RepID=A0A5K1UNC1_PLAKH|nr:prodrug activation and resistance esterase, putative [Plasmodium knowlesi strain H]OTN68743.1 putative Lysophospholipase [Plasmodium knowlesi]CAA9986164.1 prodrug activation and resistance esterase, putative [Plasmodium knowlesi strain H]SBO25356.1 lysophospholipase, putative [Plasmodium knowlesi strain H]SBO27659.1 lysophospholipase, putative [Plasmodium knowlesi strain H]VVS75638.1 prodrug activation and resistance esterase, putative [Plasmodium knowlesi strain H]|eukprot:XP_002257575.1 lysophospholipase-like protein [Plasmodium knowlesi strain H]
MAETQTAERDYRRGRAAGGSSSTSPKGSGGSARLDGKPKVDSFHNRDGLTLKTYSWQVKNPIGVIFLVHGLNTHVRLEYMRHNVDIVSSEKAILKDADNYYIYKDSWIEHFNKNGYSVYGMDHQGHGQSDGWRNLKTNVKKFDDLVYDLIQYINRVHDVICLRGQKDAMNAETSKSGSADSPTSGTSPSSPMSAASPASFAQRNNNSWSIHNNLKNTKTPPFYIMGLSMGGNIVLRTLEILGKSKDHSAKLNIRGCICLAGMISIDELASKASYKYFYIPCGKFFATVFPTLRLTPSLYFKKYPYVNQIFKYDKNRNKRPITCKLGFELLNAIENLNKDIHHIPKDIPILFVHSRHDSACFFGGAETFYKKINTNLKELHVLDDMDHVLTMEPGNERVLEKVLAWLSSLSRSDASGS